MFIEKNDFQILRNYISPLCYILYCVTTMSYLHREQFGEIWIYMSFAGTSRRGLCVHSFFGCSYRSGVRKYSHWLACIVTNIDCLSIQSSFLSFTVPMVFNQANFSIFRHPVSCYLRVSVTHVCAIVRSSSNSVSVCSWCGFVSAVSVGIPENRIIKQSFW